MLLAGSCILQGTRASQVLPFSILRRTIWSGSIQYFQKTKPANFRAGLNFQRTKPTNSMAGLNFLDQELQVQWFFDPYNNLHFCVSGSPVSAFE
jgi:hypothetical protein